MATEAASGSAAATQGGDAQAAAATAAASSQGASGGGAAAAQTQGGAATSGGQAAGAAAAGAQTTQQAAAAGDASKGAAAAEVKYELKAPEGVPPESAQKILADITALAKAKGWSPEVAQELADRDFSTLTAIDAANKQLLADHRAKWVEAVKADTQLGEAGIVAAKAAVAKADPTGEFRKLLDATGYGDHPAFVRFAAYWGRQIAEDRVEHANQGGAARPATLEDALYGASRS